MKRLLAFAFIGLTVLSISCNEESDPMETPSSETGDAVLVEVNIATTFEDTDMEADSRIWSVEPATGVTLPTDLTTGSVDITFTAPGNYTVVSTRTFNGNFTEPNNTLTFAVEVLDVVSSAVTIVGIRNDGTDGDAFTLANEGLNVISAGQSIRITNVSTGEPDETTVSFTGTDAPAGFNIDEGGIVDVQFTTAGTYGMTVTSSRTTPEGTSTTTFTDLIKVVAPVQMLWADVTSRTTIAFKYSKSLAAASLDGATYSVNYVNMGVTGSLNVSGVALDAANDSIVVVTTEEIFTSDSLLVDYSGNIADAVDGALADNYSSMFVSQALNHNGTFEGMFIDDADMLNSYPFGSSYFYGATAGVGRVIYDGNEYTTVSNWGPIVTELVGPTDVTPFDGIACGYYNNSQATDVADQASGDAGAAAVAINAGKTYYISVMVNVISGGDWFQPSDRCAAQDDSCITPTKFNMFMPFVKGWGDVFSKEISDYEGDGWVELSSTFTVAETGEIEDGTASATTYLFLRMAGIGEVAYDNLYIVEVENR